MVEITLHGKLGKAVGEHWRLDVKSISDSIHAINCLTDDLLYKFLYENGHENFEVLVNGVPLENNINGKLGDEDILEKTKSSNYNFHYGDLRTIDILPVYNLADSDILTTILGALLIVAGVLVAVGTFGGGALLGAALIVGGIGVLAAGVINLLSKPPKFEDFREIQNGGKSSYLFNGPENVTKEGGPIPVGYGRLIIGSQVVSASYGIEYYASNISNILLSQGLIKAYLFGSNDASYFKGINYNITPAADKEIGVCCIYNYTYADAASPTLTITPSNPDISAPIEAYKNNIYSSQNNVLVPFSITSNLGTNYANKSVQVILHFCEIYQNVPSVITAGTKVFKIRLNRKINKIDTTQYLTTLGTITPNSTDSNTDFDIYVLAGNSKYKNFDVLYSAFQYDDNGTFTLTFEYKSGVHRPSINAMRIFNSTATNYN